MAVSLPWPSCGRHTGQFYWGFLRASIHGEALAGYKMCVYYDGLIIKGNKTLIWISHTSACQNQGWILVWYSAQQQGLAVSHCADDKLTHSGREYKNESLHFCHINASLVGWNSPFTSQHVLCQMILFVKRWTQILPITYSSSGFTCSDNDQLLSISMNTNQ